MLLSVYLDYLNSEIHIQRLLSKYSEAATHSLLETSNKMLTTVMVLIKQHSLTHEIQSDYAWTVLLYGVSSAGVLAAELSRSSRTNQSLPPPMSRSEVIRSLSVLISYLGWVTRPGDGNYATCSEASRMLTRILDEALNPQSMPPNQQSQQPVLEPARNEDMLAPVEDQIMLESNRNGNETLPMDGEAFLDWFDSVYWNDPVVF